MLLALVAGSGCRNDHPLTIPVRGRVTLGGGPWPAPGRLIFTPEKPAPGHTHHPGMASFGPDGRFAVGTFREADGLAPGEYVVRIECWKTPPTMDGPPAESHLPAAYETGQESLPKLVVPPDAGKVEVEYDVKPPGDPRAG